MIHTRAQVKAKRSKFPDRNAQCSGEKVDGQGGVEWDNWLNTVQFNKESTSINDVENR
jgi:hypothetical protein